MSSMPPTTETAQLLKMVLTRHSQEMGREEGPIMPPLREGETTLHLTEERYSRVCLTPLLRRMAAQLMGVPITERCQRTGSAQQVQGKMIKIEPIHASFSTGHMRKIGCCLRKQMGPIMQDINTATADWHCIVLNSSLIQINQFITESRMPVPDPWTVFLSIPSSQ